MYCCIPTIHTLTHELSKLEVINVSDPCISIGNLSLQSFKIRSDAGSKRNAYAIFSINFEWRYILVRVISRSNFSDILVASHTCLISTEPAKNLSDFITV